MQWVSCMRKEQLLKEVPVIFTLTLLTAKKYTLEDFAKISAQTEHQRLPTETYTRPLQGPPGIVRLKPP